MASGSNRREEKKEETRQQLLRAAREIFSDRGYHETGIQDIVKRAGVAHGTFYLYFENKKTIFQSLIDVLLTELYGSLSVIPVENIESAADYERQLRTMTGHGAEVLTHNLDLTRLLFWEAVGLDREFNELILGLLEQFTSLGELYIEHGKRLGFLRQDLDAMTGARIVVSTVWGIAFRWAAGNIEFETARQDVEELISELLYGVVEADHRHTVPESGSSS